MDPTTTLVTFLFQTHSSVRSVQLVGSWDNFSTSYTMKRDVRRGRGQWRGCYSFKDIVGDDEAVRGSRRRNGGLKMGATYYYYYELDGSTETYDTAEPWTTACPYLPGQTVNTLSVPVERTLRKRSASLSSMHDESFRTMDPDAKFTTPRPAPARASDATIRRLGSASSLAHTRSPTPAPPWKRFFTRRLASSNPDRISLRGRTAELSLSSHSTADQACCSTPSEGSRTRDMSPGSLRRFLSEKPVARPNPHPSQMPVLVIPGDDDEEIDDDDNFATSATTEYQSYATSLAPPPFQRSVSSDSVALTIASSSSLTLATARPPSKREPDKWPAPDPAAGRLSRKLETSLNVRWSVSGTSSVLTTPVSARSAEDEPPSFYDDSNDEDEVLSSNDGDNFSYPPLPDLSSTQPTFKGYCLPRQSDEVKGLADTSTAVTSLNSPQLLAGTDSGVPISGANLLGATIDTGLDDFVNELGWIVDVIGNKQT